MEDKKLIIYDDTINKTKVRSCYYCPECGDTIFECEHCKNIFQCDDLVYCSALTQHFCKKCFEQAEIR